jgi:hypothetical protein
MHVVEHVECLRCCKIDGSINILLIRSPTRSGPILKIPLIMLTVLVAGLRSFIPGI